MTALLTEGPLAKHPFLKGASHEFFSHLEESATEASLEPGALLFKQGDYAHQLYLLVAGQVALETLTKSGKWVRVETLRPGEVVGWAWLFPPFVWPCSAKALTPCTLMMMNGAALMIRAEEDPAFGYELMKRACEHLVGQWPY